METWNETDEWADRYVRGDLSGEDRVVLIKWLEASPEHLRQFRKILQTEMRVSAAGKWRRLDRTQERVWERITPALVNRKERLYLWGMRIVAIIIVLIGVFFAWQIRQAPTEKFIPVAEVVKIESGSPKAILVMNAGEPIELKEGESRQVADVFGVKVIQDSTGGVRFEDRGEMEEEIGKSTIVVPEKGEYFVVLGDGTKVWINSGSELEFPNRFCGDIREVKVKGEAYFEVKRNPEKPFVVDIGGMQVNVLGTTFGIRAYADEREIRTTLVSGRVNVSAGKQVYELKPSEQAVFDKQTEAVKVAAVDTELFVGWKDGRLVFDNCSLERILKDLGRWYSFEVFYATSAAKEIPFSLNIRKHEKFAQVLELMQSTGKIQFEINKNTVIVK